MSTVIDIEYEYVPAGFSADQATAGVSGRISVLAIPGREVRRLAQAGPTALHPVGDPVDHCVDRHAARFGGNHAGVEPGKVGVSTVTSWRCASRR